MIIQLEKEYECKCYPGFILAADGRTCEEFNRCHLDNGNCEFKCVPDAGGEYHCECPDGLLLRPDGRTCGVSCHHCSWAMSEEECNSQGSKVCSIGENSCTYEQRRINGVTYHSKGCKQANACLSNQYQNSGWF